MSRRFLLVSLLTAAFLATSSRDSLASHGEPHWCIPPDRDDCYLEQFHQKVKDVTDLDKYIKQVQVWSLNSLVYLLSGQDPSGQTASMAESSPLAFLNRQVAQLASGRLPMTTGDYLAYKSRDTIISSPTTLAATGADYLKGTNGAFFEIWRNTRNIAYALIIIFIVAIGFMVMIRYQTDPRTTVAAVDLIPKLATTLLLITFSWVVSGLIVDLGTVGIRFSIAAFGGIAGAGGGGFWKVIFDLFAGPAIGLWTGNLADIIAIAGVYLVEGLIILPIILTVIFLIILLVVNIMLFIELTKRWFLLVILSILAPLIFLWGTLPGQEDTTATWFKNMLVSSLVFPGTTVLLTFGSIFAVSASEIRLPEAYPYLNEFSIQFLSMTLYLAAFFYATKVAAIIEDLLDVKAGGASKAGLQAGKMLSNIPVVGKMFK